MANTALEIYEQYARIEAFLVNHVDENTSCVPDSIAFYDGNGFRTGGSASKAVPGKSGRSVPSRAGLCYYLFYSSCT